SRNFLTLSSCVPSVRPSTSCLLLRPSIESPHSLPLFRIIANSPPSVFRFLSTDFNDLSKPALSKERETFKLPISSFAIFPPPLHQQKVICLFRLFFRFFI